MCSTLPSGEKQLHFSDEEKAECLNEYFSLISNVDDHNTTLPPFLCKSQNSLRQVSCTENELELLIQTLNPNKANGLDGISNRMLKLVSNCSQFCQIALFLKAYFPISRKLLVWFQFHKKETNLPLQIIDRLPF